MCCKNIFILSLVWAGLTSGEYVQSTYPSIVWNPWNPLFACNEPKINIRIGDIINFLCPSDEFLFFVPASTVPLVYENLYFLDTNKERYDTCNATGISTKRRLLNCNDVDSKLYTLSFRDIQTSEDSIKFTRGQTYYMIGTGFRVKANLKSTVNGSCRYTDDRGKYKLRLQLYVCQDNETDCHICKTEGCYYKDCGSIKCTPWISDGQVYKKSSRCFKLESRTCSDTLIGGNRQESRNVDEPCSEYQRVSQDLSSKDSTIAGLAIGIVIAFLAGIMFGLFIIKCYNKNHDKMVVENKSGPVNTVKQPPSPPPDGNVYNLFAVKKDGDANLKLTQEQGSTYLSNGCHNSAFSFESFERFSNLVSPEKMENQSSPGNKECQKKPEKEAGQKSPKKRKNVKGAEKEKNQDFLEKGDGQSKLI